MINKKCITKIIKKSSTFKNADLIDRLNILMCLPFEYMSETILLKYVLVIKNESETSLNCKKQISTSARRSLKCRLFLDVY